MTKEERKEFEEELIHERFDAMLDNAIESLDKLNIKVDMVKNPPHYNQGKIEVWDFIIDQNLDYLSGNVIKYVCRRNLKNGKEDLLKAKAYLDKLIEVYNVD